jgi:outer membrane autotransporter protein
LSGDTAVSAFYNLQDQYDANNVYLTVAQTTPFQSAGETFNQIATGAGLQSLPRGGKLRNLIGNMQDFSTARGAFDQMSGEIYASMAGARMNDASEVRQAATNRLRSAFCADSMSTAPAATSADAAAVQTCQANPDKAVRWAQVLGTRATTNGDGNAASLDHNGSGLVIGADMKVGEATRAGIFFNAKNSTYSVNDRLSSAKQQDVGVGVYASGKALESVNMDYRVGGTYTQHDVTANRRVNYKGLDESLKANFKANTTQIFGEVGSRVTLSSDFMIEPFAESTAVSALHSVKKSQDMAFATIGVRAAADYKMGNAKLSARGMVGLRNVISKNVPLSTHQFSQSDEFTVAGVPVAKNQLVTEVGVGYDINDQISVGVSYTGQFASGSRNQGLKATLEIKF